MNITDKIDKYLNEAKVTVYDNGGETTDRYTVIIGKDVFTMSNNPTSPQGVNQYAGTVGSDVKIGKHLGKKLSSIPKEIKQAVTNRMNESLSVPQKHQLKIAKKTLTMSDAGAKVMGGMTKEEAREFLKSIGWSDKKIKQLEK